MSLTAPQTDLFRYICEYKNTHGVAPSFAEMQKELGIGSKSNVYRLLSCLEERGVIRRLPNRSRAIEIVKDGERDLLVPKLRMALDRIVALSFGATTSPLLEIHELAKEALYGA
jgi:SOS-response transcriptional repressor LexA